jgi:hypothetical protein
MYFPSDHRYPGELPHWGASGHSFEDVGVAEEVAFERGEDRARQKYTWAPQITSVSTLLNQAQFNRFSTFYEDELRAGTSRFDTLVAAQGEDVAAGTYQSAWWSAQFIAPYTAEGIATSRGIHYRITAQLLLLDGPYATRTATTLRGVTRSLSQHTGQIASESVLRGLAVQTSEHPGRIAQPTMRGTAEQITEHPGEITGSEDGLVTESGDDWVSEGGERMVSG